MYNKGFLVGWEHVGWDTCRSVLPTSHDPQNSLETPLLNASGSLEQHLIHLMIIVWYHSFTYLFTNYLLSIYCSQMPAEGKGIQSWTKWAKGEGRACGMSDTQPVSPGFHLIASGSFFCSFHGVWAIPYHLNQGHHLGVNHPVIPVVFFLTWFEYSVGLSLFWKDPALLGGHLELSGFSRADGGLRSCPETVSIFIRCEE